MNILLTGSTGFLGKALSVKLEGTKNSIFYTLRSLNNLPSNNAFAVGDIDGDTNFGSALNSIEVVIHTAARAHIVQDSAADPLTEYRKVNTVGSLNLARQAAAAGVRRFIFISSIGVNGLNSLRPYTEKNNEVPHDPYSISKYEAEVGLKKIALESGMEVVIIRPPLVYGGNAPGSFGGLIKLLAKPLPLPLGIVNNKRSMVYVENLVDFIILCAGHLNAANQMFLIADGEDLSLASLIAHIRKAMGKSPLLLPIPVGLLKLAGKLTGKSGVVDRLVGDLQVDSSKARKLLNWMPPYSVKEGIAETVTDYQNRKN